MKSLSKISSFRVKKVNVPRNAFASKLQMHRTFQLNPTKFSVPTSFSRSFHVNKFLASSATSAHGDTHATPHTTTPPADKHVTPLSKYMEDYDLVATTEEQQKLATETGLPVEYIKSPNLFYTMGKVGVLFQRLGLNTYESQGEFLKKYLISPGSTTLDWVWDNPPPIHTYEEMPLIKANEHEPAEH